MPGVTVDILQTPMRVFVFGILFILGNLILWTFVIWYFRLRGKYPQSMFIADDKSKAFYSAGASYVATFIQNSRRRFNIAGFGARGNGDYYVTPRAAHFAMPGKPDPLVISAEMLNEVSLDEGIAPPMLKISWTFIDKDLESFFIFDAAAVRDALENTAKIVIPPKEEKEPDGEEQGQHPQKE